MKIPLEKHYSKPNCFDGVSDNTGRMIIFDINERDADKIIEACNNYPELKEERDKLIKVLMEISKKHDASEGYEFYKIEELLEKIK